MEAEELLRQWKEEYGYVYLTEINGNEFVYRLLGYQEYLSLENQAIDTIAMDEEICRMCILDPIISDWKEEVYAGYSSSLGQLIREESLITPKEDGSSNLKTIIAEESYAVATKFLMQIPLIIKHSFPEYSIEEIEQLNLKKQVELYAKSLWMLENFENIKMDFEEE